MSIFDKLKALFRFSSRRVGDNRTANIVAGGPVTVDQSVGKLSPEHQQWLNRENAKAAAESESESRSRIQVADSIRRQILNAASRFYDADERQYFMLVHQFGSQINVTNAERLVIKRRFMDQVSDHMPQLLKLLENGDGQDLVREFKSIRKFL